MAERAGREELHDEPNRGGPVVHVAPRSEAGAHGDVLELTVRGHADAVRCLDHVLAGGSAVLELAAPAATVVQLLEDLRRIATIETSSGAGEPSLDPTALRLLALMAAGASVKEAAAACDVSVRSAWRYLAGARESLGVASNIEALARYLQGQPD